MSLHLAKPNNALFAATSTTALLAENTKPLLAAFLGVERNSKPNNVLLVFKLRLCCKLNERSCKDSSCLFRTFSRVSSSFCTFSENLAGKPTSIKLRSESTTLSIVWKKSSFADLSLETTRLRKTAPSETFSLFMPVFLLKNGDLSGVDGETREAMSALFGRTERSFLAAAGALCRASDSSGNTEL